MIVPRGAGPLLRRKGLRGWSRWTRAATPGRRAVTVTRRRTPSTRRPVAVRDDGALPGLSRLRVGAACFFAGDTDLFAGMREIGDERLDLALLPIWGWGPRLPEGHLTPATAAEALVRLRPRVAIPIHWGTLAPLTARPRRRRPQRPAAPGVPPPRGRAGAGGRRAGAGAGRLDGALEKTGSDPVFTPSAGRPRNARVAKTEQTASSTTSRPIRLATMLQSVPPSEALAAGLDGPVDRVELRHRLHPVRHQALLHERRRQEGQRQQEEVHHRDQRLLAPRQSARAFESAPNDAPSSAATAISTTTPAMPLGKRRRRPGEPDDDHRLDQDHERACSSRPAMSAPRATGDTRKPVDDAAVDVLDHRHAAPAGREQRGHDHHARASGTAM